MNLRLAALGVVSAAIGLVAIADHENGLADASRPYRAYLAAAARDGEHVPPTPSASPGQLPRLPAGWPNTLELGQADSPGGAAESGSRGFGFRYQYLAGGANTGNGWANWNPNGSFVTSYISESVQADVIPVFSYYMVRHSNPGATMEEPVGVRTNLANAATMRAIFDDLQLFFSRARESGAPRVILHFEPDLWGYIQQRSQDDDGSNFEAAVASSGHPLLGGLANNASGLAGAVIALRDAYGPNVLVAFHLSLWGTGTDPLYADPEDKEIEQLAGRSARFYHSLGADFDLAFAEMSDRDAAFKQYIYGDGGASWWDEGDFARNAAYLREFVRSSGLRVVLWQLPQGNTRMRSMNNTWNHFQDNKVEWLLGDATFSRLQVYRDAGVIGLLFGRGADGATCACDAAGDGVTNPPPINGNTREATSADDDGGYFRERAGVYTGGDTLPLP